MQVSTLRLTSFVTIFAMLLTLLQAILLPLNVFAATIEWDGGGVDANFSTDENWVGDTAPVAGDDLVFDNDTADFVAKAPINDIVADTSFNSITLNGSDTDSLTITGNSITLAGDVTNDSDPASFATINLNVGITLSTQVDIISNGYGVDVGGSGNTLDLGSNNLGTSGANSVTIRADVTGTGDMNFDTDTNLYGENSGFDGGITITSSNTLLVSSTTAFGSATGSTTIANDAVLNMLVSGSSDVDVSEDISIGGSSNPALDFDYSGSFDPITTAAPQAPNITFSGTVTLTADTQVSTSLEFSGSTISFDDLAASSFELLIQDGSAAGVAYGGQTYKADRVTNTIADDDAATNVAVVPNSTSVINGVRGDTAVHRDGILKGTGTVGALTIFSGGTLAPGESPGCLNSGDLIFNSGSTFEVEIDGTEVCTEYDQMQVTGSVDLGDATLSLLLGASVDLSGGEELVIISNDGSDAVSGTFTGYAEGATVSAGGEIFTISYAGGDGNDVTLSIDAPDAPDTGFMLASVNPALIAAATLLSVVTLGGLGQLAARQQR